MPTNGIWIFLYPVAAVIITLLFSLWRNKHKVDIELKKQTDIVLNPIQSEEEKSRRELEALIKVTERIKETAHEKYVYVAPPKNDINYWEEISKILDNPNWQWFISQMRETVLAQHGNDIIKDSKEHFKFLTTGDQIAGGVKTIDNLCANMEKLRSNIKALERSESPKDEI